MPILILGESGTGKELIARLVHHLSSRAIEGFVPLNCAAIPKDLFESILFGHKKGAFTGASQDHPGKFDTADKGTIFLDEIAELPPAIHKDLAASIVQGTFREDLFFRLNVGVINLPSLRERRSDIPRIALHILDKVNERLRKPKRLANDSLKVLQLRAWPGNVRELENTIERTAWLAKKDTIEPGDLAFVESAEEAGTLIHPPDLAEGFSLEEYLVTTRKVILERALEVSGGNQSRAARLLGISPQAVNKFLKTQD